MSTMVVDPARMYNPVINPAITVHLRRRDDPYSLMGASRRLSNGKSAWENLGLTPTDGLKELGKMYNALPTPADVQNEFMKIYAGGTTVALVGTGYGLYEALKFIRGLIPDLPNPFFAPQRFREGIIAAIRNNTEQTQVQFDPADTAAVAAASRDSIFPELALDTSEYPAGLALDTNRSKSVVLSKPSIPDAPSAPTSGAPEHADVHYEDLDPSTTSNPVDAPAGSAASGAPDHADVHYEDQFNRNIVTAEDSGPAGYSTLSDIEHGQAGHTQNQTVQEMVSELAHVSEMAEYERPPASLAFDGARDAADMGRLQLGTNGIPTIDEVAPMIFEQRRNQIAIVDVMKTAMSRDQSFTEAMRTYGGMIDGEGLLSSRAAPGAPQVEYWKALGGTFEAEEVAQIQARAPAVSGGSVIQEMYGNLTEEELAYFKASSADQVSALLQDIDEGFLEYLEDFKQGSPETYTPLTDENVQTRRVPKTPRMTPTQTNITTIAAKGVLGVVGGYVGSKVADAVLGEAKTPEDQRKHEMIAGASGGAMAEGVVNGAVGAVRAGAATALKGLAGGALAGGLGGVVGAPVGGLVTNAIMNSGIEDEKTKIVVAHTTGAVAGAVSGTAALAAGASVVAAVVPETAAATGIASLTMGAIAAAPETMGLSLVFAGVVGLGMGLWSAFG